MQSIFEQFSDVEVSHNIRIARLKDGNVLQIEGLQDVSSKPKKQKRTAETQKTIEYLHQLQQRPVFFLLGDTEDTIVFIADIDRKAILSRIPAGLQNIVKGKLYQHNQDALSFVTKTEDSTLLKRVKKWSRQNAIEEPLKQRFKAAQHELRDKR